MGRVKSKTPEEKRLEKIEYAISILEKEIHATLNKISSCPKYSKLEKINNSIVQRESTEKNLENIRYILSGLEDYKYILASDYPNDVIDDIYFENQTRLLFGFVKDANYQLFNYNCSNPKIK